MVDLARRGFFRGRPRPKAENRPPWALPEIQFIDRCTRCGECQKACPTQLITVGDGGYPSLDFSRAECTFCGDCAAICQPRALNRQPDVPPWALQAVISDGCLPKRGVECRTCGDFCDQQALRFLPRMGGSPIPDINLDRCTGCGACVAPCPTHAILILAPKQGNALTS